MFERFTERARRVVVLAQDEAVALNHAYIGTEHLLLGLISEGDGQAAEALRRLGVRSDDVRREVVSIIGRGKDEPSGHIPFTPRAKKVLELSLREALDMDLDYIGTEHILLGLVHEGEGVAAQVLVRLGAELAAVRATVREVLQLPPAERGGGRASPLAEGLRAVGVSRRHDEILTRLDAIAALLERIDRRLGGTGETGASGGDNGDAGGERAG